MFRLRAQGDARAERMEFMPERFELVSEYTPTGDQPEAIREIVANLGSGVRDQVLLE